MLNARTGTAPREEISDAIAALLSKTLTGFGEIFRQFTYSEIGSREISFRAIADIHNSAIVFSVPDSINAVQLALESLIFPELRHLTGLMRK